RAAVPRASPSPWAARSTGWRWCGAGRWPRWPPPTASRPSWNRSKSSSSAADFALEPLGVVEADPQLAELDRHPHHVAAGGRVDAGLDDVVAAAVDDPAALVHEVDAVGPPHVAARLRADDRGPVDGGPEPPAHMDDEAVVGDVDVGPVAAQPQQ